MKLKYILMLLPLFVASCTKYETGEMREGDSTYYYIYPEEEEGDLDYGVTYSGNMVSIQQFGVEPGKDANASTNKINLQKAIDWAAKTGTALYVTPAQYGYRVLSGITLKNNVSLIGAHGPTGRGTMGGSAYPTGSLFVISDKSQPFITVENATQIKGIQFYYEDQTFTDVSKVQVYPATIQCDRTIGVGGVYLSCLTFYGETQAFDFSSSAMMGDLVFEHCYGFPLSGKFIDVKNSNGQVRVLHCHVNPANMRALGHEFKPAIVDYIVQQQTFTYSFNNVKNAQVFDMFTFGVFGGCLLGNGTSGNVTNFNFDCVQLGFLAEGDGTWSLSQGSIIANASYNSQYSNIHPFLIGGSGTVFLSDIDCFSGYNGALSSTMMSCSTDVIAVQGSEALRLVGENIRGYNYRYTYFNRANNNAIVRLTNLFDNYNLREDISYN